MSPGNPPPPINDPPGFLDMGDPIPADTPFAVEDINGQLDVENLYDIPPPLNFFYLVVSIEGAGGTLLPGIQVTLNIAGPPQQTLYGITNNDGYVVFSGYANKPDSFTVTAIGTGFQSMIQSAVNVTTWVTPWERNPPYGKPPSYWAWVATNLFQLAKPDSIFTGYQASIVMHPVL